MKQLNGRELHALTEAWESWTSAAPNMSQLRSRERLLVVFLLIRYGALRLSEALQINDLKDFDFPTGTIRVGGSRGREVQIPQKAMQEVSALLNSPRMHDIRGAVTHMDQGYVRRRFYAMSELCGLQPEAIGPQAVRQSRAAELLQANIPLNIVQKFMGQLSPVQTAGFISFTDDDARRIVHDHLRQEALRRSSARNAFTGTVTRVQAGAVSVFVEVTTLQGERVRTIITIESMQRLGIHEGQLLNTTVKAPFVMVERPREGRGDAVNRFLGRVADISLGDVEAGVVVEVSADTRLCAIMSRDELDALALAMGDEVEVFFSPFASVLGLPDD